MTIYDPGNNRSYDPAWVREVRPTKKRKMTRYEVIVAGKKVATKYTRTGAEVYARGLNLLMK